MLSYHANWCSHFGQNERSRFHVEMPRGRRYASMFVKLPKIAPSSADAKIQNAGGTLFIVLIRIESNAGEHKRKNERRIQDSRTADSKFKIQDSTKRLF